MTFSLSDHPDLAALVADAREAFSSDLSYSVEMMRTAGRLKGAQEHIEGPSEPLEPLRVYRCPANHPHGENASCREKHGCTCTSCSEGVEARARARREKDREVYTPRPVSVRYTAPRPAPEKAVPRPRPERVNNTPAPTEKQEKKKAILDKGHPSHYQHRTMKCRCEACVLWARAEARRWRENALVQPLEPADHGRSLGYQKNCRCSLCQKWKQDQNKKYLAKRKADKARNS